MAAYKVGEDQHIVVHPIEDLRADLRCAGKSRITKVETTDLAYALDTIDEMVKALREANRELLKIGTEYPVAWLREQLHEALARLPEEK